MKYSDFRACFSRIISGFKKQLFLFRNELYGGVTFFRLLDF